MYMGIQAWTAAYGFYVFEDILSAFGWFRPNKVEGSMQLDSSNSFYDSFWPIFKYLVMG